eukprot:2762841-Lingulodinium_polyedra.AAC.1
MPTPRTPVVCPVSRGGRPGARRSLQGSPRAPQWPRPSPRRDPGPVRRAAAEPAARAGLVCP